MYFVPSSYINYCAFICKPLCLNSCVFCNDTVLCVWMYTYTWHALTAHTLYIVHTLYTPPVYFTVYIQYTLCPPCIVYMVYGTYRCVFQAIVIQNVQLGYRLVLFPFVVFTNSTLIINILQFVAVTQSQQDTYRCNANNTAGSNYRLTEVSLSGKQSQWSRYELTYSRGISDIYLSAHSPDRWKNYRPIAFIQQCLMIDCGFISVGK